MDARICLKCKIAPVPKMRFRFLCDKCNHENDMSGRCRAEDRGHAVIFSSGNKYGNDGSGTSIGGGN